MSKILVIEDEIDITKVLRRRLTDQGFQVSVANDAYEGTRLIHDESPDLILLDLMLPAGGGLSVLKNMRISPKIGYIPVVVLTGMKDEETKKKVLDEGVDAYLEKPYDWDVLIGTIQNILNKKGK